MTKYLIALWLIGPLALADEVETIYITGGAKKVRKQPGSAHMVEDKEISESAHTDPVRILEKVPGVNIQEEDGEGLRPNIGLRGAHPHRSRKVVLMEDGVLIGPAPYSAPAAYYFPILTKTSNIEVFKGPVAIKYGPNTIGGAVNLVTRPIPATSDSENFIDLGYGSFGSRKAHAYHGVTRGRWGWIVEGASIASDGFKELDGGGPTGFIKNDVSGKLRWTTSEEASRYQEFQLKLSWANERSHETYLGLTEDDFRANPYRRYRASAQGRMSWVHQQAQFSHYTEFGDISVTTDVYRHEFERAWRKFNRFDGSIRAADILNRPDDSSHQTLLRILRGEEDSTAPTGEDRLMIGTNDRTYFSEGVQTQVVIPFEGQWSHEWELGLRYHRDGIDRDHTEERYQMLSGELVDDGSGQRQTTDNADRSEAISASVQHAVTANQLTVTYGVRGEFVETTRDDKSASDQDSENKDQIVSPGAGLYYQWTESLGLLAGVYQGFTLVGPGQSDDVKPEDSINYEAGFRYGRGEFYSEMIGFYNDYANIKGTCSFSSGCSNADLDREFDGGRAEVIGLESLASHKYGLGEGRSLDSTINYTYTKAHFLTESESENEQWGIGDIKPKDPLPYIPLHQGSAKVSLNDRVWSTALAAKYTGRRFDQSVADGRKKLPEYVVYDWMSSYRWDPAELYLGVDNLLARDYIVSLRPFGARPGKRRTFKGGVKARF